MRSTATVGPISQVVQQVGQEDKLLGGVDAEEPRARRSIRASTWIHRVERHVAASPSAHTAGRHAVRERGASTRSMRRGVLPGHGRQWGEADAARQRDLPEQAPVDRPRYRNADAPPTQRLTVLAPGCTALTANPSSTFTPDTTSGPRPAPSAWGSGSGVRSGAPLPVCSDARITVRASPSNSAACCWRRGRWQGGPSSP